ncbi:hypothetical protein [Oceanobacillus chungangensis]|uniref:Uncharacterized protein n=1 Tax=Oceanobacillus chungangensis TaxID=1229152 RepID=A0A3D8PK14_9BACI|nr:hypothetical protein [Oceanobacillus chungangensis]RDW15571.1 hypothetical protein CWR45_17500 [Oceanobacillus chungangensis]
MRLRSAIAQGDSPAARGKRIVFPERLALEQPTSKSSSLLIITANYYPSIENATTYIVKNKK